MHSLDEIISQRSSPGILIYSQGLELLYMNSEARSLLGRGIPEEIASLAARANSNGQKEDSTLISVNGGEYTARSVPLFRHLDSEPFHLMIILEKYSLRSRLDIERVRARFGLTNRETQVVSEIVKGSSNLEIAFSLSISEYTVKDHIKNVMGKLGVNSRSMIICRVIEP